MSDEDETVQVAESTQSTVESLRIKLPGYDGMVDPKSWLRQLEKAKKAKKWSDEQLIAQAPLLLTGRADEFWETIEGETSTWKDFREKFLYEFGERKTAGEHLCELTRITRTKGEPFNVLLWRIQQKYKLAFPDTELTQESVKVMLVARFISSLVDSKSRSDQALGLHLKLHYKAEKDPSNIVKIACDLEQTFVDSKVESTVNTVAIDDPEMAFPRNEEGPCSTTISESCLSALEDRIVTKVIAALSTSDDQKSRQGQRGDGQRDGTEKGRFKGRGCFICEGPHFRRECPYKDACQRCWEKGHTARYCTAAKPIPGPLNSKRLGVGH